MEQNKVALVKSIGKTTYVVRVHFNEEAKETMKDKINRMIKNDIANNGCIT